MCLDMNFTSVNLLDNANSNLSRELFGYLVVSQLNTVESVGRLENNVIKLIL